MHSERCIPRCRFWLTACVVVMLDQFTKSLVARHIPLDGPGIPLFPGVALVHVLNRGVAFGQLQQAGPLLIVAAAAAALFIVAYRGALLRAAGTLHPLLDVGLALALGGAIGNMLDRIRLARVVDFIQVGWWPVFNVADSAITIGAVLLILYFLTANRSEHPRAADAEL